MMSTPISETVLEFYKELPFNYRDSVEDHALSILENKTTYDVLTPFLKPKFKILEIGCGAGWLSNRIAYHNSCDITAIDFNPVAIERAKLVGKYIGNKVDFQVADLFEYEINNKTDLVVSLGVLHHTGRCLEGLDKICDSMSKGSTVFIGLYHKYGRKPFLDEFSKIKDEDEKFARYCELDSRFTDETHLRSWFRDQVLHPHETTHTMKEVTEVLEKNNMKLMWTSIRGEEEEYENMALEKLKNNEYWPGFFLFMAKKEI